MRRAELEALLAKAPFTCDDAWKVSLEVPTLIKELEKVWAKLLEGQRHKDGSECKEVVGCGLPHVSKRAIDAAMIKHLEAELNEAKATIRLYESEPATEETAPDGD